METVVRVLFFYLVIVAGVRLLGKRQFSQLSPLDLVTLLLIPELVQQAMVREDFSATNALIALCTLFATVFATSLLSHRSRAVERLFEGKPAVLVYNGKLVLPSLDYERVTPDEIYGEMRQYGLERIEQVKWALLEPDGRLSIIPLDPRHRQTKPRPESIT